MFAELQWLSDPDWSEIFGYFEYLLWWPPGGMRCWSSWHCAAIVLTNYRLISFTSSTYSQDFLITPFSNWISASAIARRSTRSIKIDQSLYYRPFWKFFFYNLFIFSKLFFLFFMKTMIKVQILAKKKWSIFVLYFPNSFFCFSWKQQ